MCNYSSARRSRQRDRLILALLEQPSLNKAAASIGMSTTTAWRVSKTPEFQEEYRLARREAYSHTVARLQHASGAAASLMFKLLGNFAKNLDIKPIHLRAAEMVLEQSWKGMQFEDLAARLARLEQAIKK
jgi:hypothetical protein